MTLQVRMAIKFFLTLYRAQELMRIKTVGRMLAAVHKKTIPPKKVKLCACVQLIDSITSSGLIHKHKYLSCDFFLQVALLKIMRM